MPLGTQLLASADQKRQAALATMNVNSVFVGYTTKAHHPIYMLSSSSFPLQPCPSDAGWITSYLLPKQIVAQKVSTTIKVRFSMKCNPTQFMS